jgi:hypothetical protein
MEKSAKRPSKVTKSSEKPKKRASKKPKDTEPEVISPVKTIEPEEPPRPKTKVEILTEHYERLVISKMTPRAIEKWLVRNVERTDLPVFCSIGMIDVDIRQEPFKKVAIEVWQHARVLKGKERYRFNR